MFKKTIYFIIAIFLLTSCTDTFSNVKRGLTGEKRNSTDEFLVEKKDPLILPPDYDKLPTPDDRKIAKDEISIFENTLEKTSTPEDISSGSDSAEQSILRQIRKK